MDKMEKFNFTPVEVSYLSPTWTNSMKNLSKSSVNFAKNNRIKTLMLLSSLYGVYRGYGFYKALRETFGFGSSSTSS